MKLSEELAWRGFVNQTTLSSITDLDEGSRKFYWGCDPSSDSLTIGNLAAGMMARVFVKHGYEPVILIGGATGMIGDPKDDEERALKSLDEIERNKQGIAAQYSQIFSGMPFQLVDNYDWFKDMGYLQFLREVGKQFSMTQLLDREFVKARVGEGKAGLSYAEFSYSLIQGYDFLHLYREYGVTLQLSGSDQWGNSLSGVEMIRKNENAEAHVWTSPLVINKSTGMKFGKSEGGAVWLDENKTSVFKYYQFWLNADDEGVIDYLKVYTLLEKDEIDKLEASTRENPGAREAQKTLAYEATKLIHGEEAARTVQKVTEVVFGAGDARAMSEEELAVLAAELPTSDVVDLVEALVSTGLASSNGDARRLIGSGAVSVNGQKVDDTTTLTKPALIKKGKNSFALVR